MTLAQIMNALLIVAAAGLAIYWMVSQGEKLKAKQKSGSKPKAPGPAVADNIVDNVSLESIEGLWRMISVGRNGNFAPKAVIDKANLTIAIVGGTFTVTNSLEMSTVELNNKVTPNQLDQIDANGDKHLCIVRLRNGCLEICQGEAGRPRPTDFNRKRKDGASLTMFERIADTDDSEKRSAG
jgi:uncharacterized protein (TIGR03067 family)